ncbi:RNA polymerase sigma-70 factor, ECF subfamily [Paenibacillus sp. UNC496MF]|uniref:sigma-70 family RNA polymerase sigma factor n=1 Tax=Paenibacillus sp. UNC496MF TaxID=1502753 RepID=UPI0008E1D9BC|nr:sigma-70 family RNA polymerase sigma factor [Paenibacillus sp. UNC496MF]SFJ44664.1 RNA polymerase sigma-70 factor, ECF subfamily [Paenibacillus sp. UNC496MF]
MDIEQNVMLAQNGDRDAFIKLIKETELSQYTVARSILKGEEDCADAIQETILKAYGSIGSLKSPAYFKTWLIRILINECNSILRKRKRPVEAGMNNHFPSNAVETKAVERIILQDAINQLEDSLRLVVTLFYFEDMPVKSIADCLGLSQGTVKSRLHRSRYLLSEMLRLPAEERSPGYDY